MLRGAAGSRRLLRPPQAFAPPSTQRVPFRCTVKVVSCASSVSLKRPHQHHHRHHQQHHHQHHQQQQLSPQSQQLLPLRPSFSGPALHPGPGGSPPRRARVVPRFKVSPTEAELTQLATRLRRRRAAQQQQQQQPLAPQQPDANQPRQQPAAAPPERRSRERTASAPGAHVVLPGSLPRGPPGPGSGPGPGGGGGGGWRLVRTLWWAYLSWLCTRWLSLSVYGMQLRALALAGRHRSHTSHPHPPPPPGAGAVAVGPPVVGVLVAANHISQLDHAVVTVALRSLGIDDVLILGERDFPTTLTSTLLGNVLPLLRVETDTHTPTIAEGPLEQGRDRNRNRGQAGPGAPGPAAAAASPRGLVGAGFSYAAEREVVAEIRRALLPLQGEAEEKGAGGAAETGTGGRVRAVALVVFPERAVGGREGSLRPWRLSVAALAAGLGCPVVPAFISGTQRCLPQHFSIPTRTRVSLELGLPLPPPPPAPAPKQSKHSPHSPHSPQPAATSTMTTQPPDPLYQRRLAVYDSRVRDSQALLRALARARRASGWRARARNRRPVAGGGLLAHLRHAVWLCWGWLSVAAAAAFLAAARLLDCVKAGNCR
ncbi:hypothetical protein PLESTF_001939900 [Pleodorina starrii]|nr:hypothetical protein PLESTF_001939900 [Pleodorina starrii]